MSLRDEQRDALAQLAATRQRGGHRGLLLMAPSLGKTRVAAEDVASYMTPRRRSRILYVAHRESILLQAARTFHDITGITDIGFAMSGRPVNLNAQLVMASVPFLYNRLDRLGRQDFDYGVHDESHHDPAPTFRAVLDHFDMDFWLGMTGSEDRLDRQPITAFFGEPVFSLPFARALARGLFPPIDYHLIANGMGRPFDFDPGKRVSLERINREFFGPGDDFSRLPHIARYMNSLPPAQATLYFLMGTMSADEFHSHIGGEVMHSQLAHDENVAALKRFANGTSHNLVSVDMVSEGTDIPRIDRMGLVRRTLSKSRWFQWIGRGLREAEGKTGLSVYDFAGNFERILMLMELVAEIEHETQVYRDETGENGRDILGDSFSFHFDDTAVDLVVALEQSTRPKPQTQAEALAIAVDWVGKHNGRIPTYPDFLESFTLPSYDWTTDLWKDEPPAKGSFNLALRDAYIAARAVNPSLPELKWSQRPEPSTQAEALDMLVSWIRDNDGKLAVLTDFLNDDALPAYSRVMTLWSDADNRKHDLDEAIVAEYNARRAIDPTMPELTYKRFRPRPRTREALVELFANWMKDHNGQVPTAYTCQTHPELPSFASAMSLYADVQDPVRTLYFDIARAYEAKRANDPLLPALIMPTKRIRPIPRSREEAVDMVVAIMIDKRGQDVATEDFADISRPTLKAVGKFFAEYPFPFRYLRLAAQNAYIAAAIEDETMPRPRFDLAKPEAEGREAILSHVVIWMSRNRGLPPTDRSFRGDVTLPTFEAVRRAWDAEAIPLVQAFRTDAIVAYDAVAAQNGWPQPERRIERPKPTSAEHALKLVIEWMRNNGGSFPTWNDFDRSETLPRYALTMRLLGANPPRGIRPYDMFRLTVDAAYRARVDPKRPVLQIRPGRPEIKNKWDVLNSIVDWVVEREEEGFPGPWDFKSDPTLPRWKDVTRFYDSYEELRTAFAEELGVEMSSKARQREKRPHVDTRREAIQLGIDWVGAADRRASISAIDIRQNAALPGPKQLAELWTEAKDPVAAYIAAVGGALGVARPRPAPATKDESVTVVLPWTRTHMGRAPLARELRAGEADLPSVKQIRELWNNDIAEYQAAVILAYRASARGPSDPEPDMVMLARVKPPTTKAEAIHRLTPWMAKHGGRLPRSTELTINQGLFSSHLMQRLWADDSGEDPKSRFNRDALTAYEQARATQPDMPQVRASAISGMKGIRPQPRTVNDLVSVVADWAENNENEIPLKADYVEDPRLPEYSRVKQLMRPAGVGQRSHAAKDAMDEAVRVELERRRAERGDSPTEQADSAAVTKTQPKTRRHLRARAAVTGDIKPTENQAATARGHRVRPTSDAGMPPAYDATMSASNHNPSPESGTDVRHRVARPKTVHEGLAERPAQAQAPVTRRDLPGQIAGR